MLEITKYQSSQVELAKIDGEDKSFQCRQVTDGDVKDMAATLKEHGQKFPIVLLRRRNGRLVIICGFTRFLGAKQLGWATIAAIIIPEEDFENEAEIRKFGIIENSKRKQLTDVDKANICKELSAIGVSNVEIGNLIGKSEKQVRRYLKVANASGEEKQKLLDGKTSIRGVTGEQLGSRAEQNVDNSNCYVKSTKNGFTAVLKYQYGRDKADIIKDFKAKIDAQYQKLQKTKADAGKGEALKAAPLNEAQNLNADVADAIKKYTPTGIVLTADPTQSGGEGLTGIKLDLGGTMKVYVRSLLASGQWLFVMSGYENIKWTAPDGVEVTPCTGPEVEIKLVSPLTEPKEIKVSTIIQGVGEISVVLKAEQRLK